MSTPLADRLVRLGARLPSSAIAVWIELNAIATEVRRAERMLDEIVAEAAEQERRRRADELLAAHIAASPNVLTFPARGGAPGGSGGRAA